MPDPDEHNPTIFPKPMELKLADIVFLSVRKNLMLFKDLRNKNIHYSIFIRGSLVDFHKTLENQHRHIPLVEIQFDWQSLMRKILQEMKDNWRSIFQIVKTGDPQWRDLEVEFIPAKSLMELLSPLVKGIRWNIDQEFAEELDTAMACSRLEELAAYEPVIGTGSGYLVISYGTECFLFDIEKMSKIIERSFERSIRNIHLRYYTLSLTLWYVKIKLQTLLLSKISGNS